MEDLLISLLESFNYPIMRQGSLSDDPYPDSFFTFWNNDSIDGNHYDNEEISINGYYDVNFYSIDPSLTYSQLRAARKLLKQNGFIISGDGYDVLSDESTHTGRGMTAIYMNYNKEE